MKISQVPCFIFCCFLLLNTIELSGQSIEQDQLNAQADTLILKAEEQQKTKKIDEAVQSIRQAQAIYQKAKNWEEYVASFTRIANYLSGHAEVQTCLKTLDQTIVNAEKYLTKHHKLAVKALWKKGEIYIAQGKLDTANLILQKAIFRGKKSESWEALSWAYIMQSVANYYQSDFKAMEGNLDSALVLSETKIKSPETHLATIAQLYPILFDATGDYEKSFIASKKNLERFKIRPILNQSDSLALANAYNNHGAICYEKGDYDQAIHHYKIALSLKKQTDKVSSNLDLIQINNNIGIAYQRKTNWKLAQNYLNASKSLLSDSVDDNNFKEWIHTHQLLAANYVDQEDFNAAIPLLENLLPSSAQYKVHQYWIHGTYGRALSAQKKTKAARTHLIKTLSKAKEKLGTQHPHIALLNRLAGDTYLAEDSWSVALSYYQKALSALTPNFSDTIKYSNPSLESITALTAVLPCLEAKAKTLAILAQQDSKWDQLSLETYRLAISTIDRMREDYETEEAKLLLSNTAKGIYEASIGLLYQLYEKTKDETLLAEAFQYAEKSKSILLLEMIRSSKARQKINPLYARDTSFYKLLEKGKMIKTELLFFEQKLAQAQQEKLDSEHPKSQNAETALARLYQENLNWKAKVKKLYPAYYDLQYDQSFVDISTVQEKLLKENAAFLEYFVGQDASFVFIITENNIEFLQLQNHQELEFARQAFQNLLLNPAVLNQNAKLAYSDYNKAAYRVYQIILEKAIASLPPKINKLTIVPDGTLNSIPFEALNSKLDQNANIDFGKLPYVLNQFKIHYGYSANLLLSNQNRYEEVPSNVECLALAPPYVNMQASLKGNLKNLRSHNGALAGAADEIRNIALHFPGQFDLSSTATELFFKQNATDFGILHLAMHGIANYDNPNFAHLKFGEVTSDSLEDNHLYHYEIAELKLQSQLAVLSACETGLGKYEEGEGVFSLARSFMYAGVPSVMMSLWKIDDQSTGRLMPLFYERLSINLDKDLALQIAKIDFLRESDLEFRHPFYWSGMVLLGNEQALKKEFTLGWWYLGGMVLLVFGLFLLRKNLVS